MVVQKNIGDTIDGTLDIRENFEKDGEKKQQKNVCIYNQKD